MPSVGPLDRFLVRVEREEAVQSPPCLSTDDGEWPAAREVEEAGRPAALAGAPVDAGDGHDPVASPTASAPPLLAPDPPAPDPESAWQPPRRGALIR